MEPKANYQRPASTEVTAKEILDGEYVLDNGNATNYLLIRNIKVFYVNLLGVILRKEATGSITNLWLDDGTEQIVLRFFEEHRKTREIEVGDVVLIIGRPRIYNTEKYVSPEIVSKVDPLWLKVRATKLGIQKAVWKVPTKDEQEHQKHHEEKPKIQSEIVNEEEIEEEPKKEELLPGEKISKLIKELDKGFGVPIETILEQSSLTDTEVILKRMLEQGEIFENSPGKVKVL